jgi:hypothetical protein
MISCPEGLQVAAQGFTLEGPTKTGVFPIGNLGLRGANLRFAIERVDFDGKRKAQWHRFPRP